MSVRNANTPPSSTLGGRTAYFLRTVAVRLPLQNPTLREVTQGALIPVVSNVPALVDGNSTALAATVGNTGTSTVRITIDPLGEEWDVLTFTARSNRTESSPTTVTVVGGAHADWVPSRNIVTDFNTLGQNQIHTIEFFAGGVQTGTMSYTASSWAAGGTFDYYEMALAKRQLVAIQVEETASGVYKDVTGASFVPQVGDQKVFTLASDSASSGEQQVWVPRSGFTGQFIRETIMVDVVELPNDVPNAKTRGALADGLGTQLSARYATLTAAQADFPAAIALSDTIDWAALQSLIDEVYNTWLAGVTTNGSFPTIDIISSPNPRIFIPSGVYSLNRPINVRGLTLEGVAPPQYVVRQNTFASATNTAKGTILRFIGSGADYTGGVCVDMSPDHSQLINIVVDGQNLNKGTVAVGSIVATYSGGQRVTESTSGRGQVDQGYRFIVIDPLDPEQTKASIETNDLPPIYLGTPEYSHWLQAWPGPYTTLGARTWTLAAGSDTLPPGLTLSSSGRISGTFTPTSAGDYRTYTPTLEYTYTVNGVAASLTKQFTIGVVEGYVEDFEFPTLTEGRTLTWPLRIVNTGAIAHTVSIKSTNLSGLSVTSAGVVTVLPAVGSAGQYYVEFEVLNTVSGRSTTRRYNNLSVVTQATAPAPANLDDIKRVWVQGQARTVPVLVSGGTDPITVSVDLTQTLTGFENQNTGFPRLKSGFTDVWELGPGLELNGPTKTISGTPTQANRYTFYLKITDSTGRTNTQPVILTPESDPALKPYIFSTAFPPAVKGVAYNHQVDIRVPGGVTLEGVSLLPLPTGLSVSASGLITGTPTGMAKVNGVGLRFSARASGLTVRNFHSTAAVSSSGSLTIPGPVNNVSNLHQFDDFIVKNSRYGFQFGRLFDSHFKGGYIAGCWIGMDLQSGTAANTFTDIRVEFIGKHGVQGSFAKENLFTACYFDTCGQNAVSMDSCNNLTVTGCLFFRSGRLVPGQGTPQLPNADRTRSCHINLTNCNNTTLSDNKTLVGRHAEGASNNFVYFHGQEDWARPATALRAFNCEAMTLSGDFTGCTHESISITGLPWYAQQPHVGAIQAHRFRLDEQKLDYGVTHNLLYNAGAIINQRSSNYLVPPGGVAGRIVTLDGWELSWGAISQQIELYCAPVTDRRLPFTRSIHIKKAKEAGAAAGATQTLVLLNNTMRSQLPLVVGKTLIMSYWARSRVTTSGDVLASMTFNTGDNAQGGATTVFGSDSVISTGWNRYTSTIQVPALTEFDWDSDFNSFVGWRLLLDNADKDYDIELGGFQCELAPSHRLPRSFNTPTQEAEWAFAAQWYQKSLPTTLYFGETGANFVNSGTVQVRSNGVQNPLVQVNFPYTLNRDILGSDNFVKVVNFRSAADRGSSDFNRVAQINPGTTTTFPFSLDEVNRRGFTVSVLPESMALPAAGSAAVFHWEYESDLTQTSLLAPVIGSVNPVVATEGTTVTITGARFTPTMTLTDAGSTSIPFTFVSTSQVTFTALDSYTDGPLTVTTANGSCTSDPIIFTPAPRNTTLLNTLTYTESLISAQTVGTSLSPRPAANANNNNTTDGFTLTNVGGGATVDYRVTFASPTFINRMTLYLGQFNGGFNAPQTVTVYRGGTKADPVIYSATMHTLPATDGTTKTHIYNTGSDVNFDVAASVYLVSFGETPGSTVTSVNEIDFQGYTA